VERLEDRRQSGANSFPGKRVPPDLLGCAIFHAIELIPKNAYHFLEWSVPGSNR